MDPNATTITVEDVIQNHARWGVPHFQRGSVWGVDNVSALLESLFWDTPCGSFILWEQSNPRYGVPLGGNDFDYLLVDGQQRTRSILAAFGVADDLAADEANGDESGEDGQEASEPALPTCWSLNLNRLDAFWQGIGQESSRRRTPLFVRIQEPGPTEQKRLRQIAERKAKGKSRYMVPESRFKYNFIPLHYLESGNFLDRVRDGSIFLRCQGGEAIPGSAILPLALERLEEVGRRVSEMRKRKFFLKVLAGGTPLEDVVSVFLRINGGGRPVQEEEKAFSTLVNCSDPASHPGGGGVTADEWIRRIFDAVHGGGRTRVSPHRALDRDDALSRMSERAFGFKLFIRIFLLASNYHTGRAVGTTSLSFGILQDPAFLDSLRLGQDEPIWKVTCDVVLAMKDLLEKELHLDSFQFLPDSRSLTPVFMLLVKYPGLLESQGTDAVRVQRRYRAGLAWFALALLAKHPSEQDVMKWTTEILKSHQDARTCLQGRLKHMEKAFEHAVLNNGLSFANSLTNRFTLLLYGLERSQGARDFSYSGNGLTTEGFRCAERVIGRDASPEKQHIVPYSLLAPAYNPDAKSRVASSESNNIGNITYISRKMNFYEDGLGSRMLKLSIEPDPNLRAHLIDPPALAAYDAVRRIEEPEAAIEAFKGAYEKWTLARREVIARGFQEWAARLLDSWKELAEAPEERIEPAKPILLDVRYGPHLAHLIRELDLPNATEDALIALFADERISWKRVGKGTSPLDLVLAVGGRKAASAGLARESLILRPVQPSPIDLASPDAPEQLVQLRSAVERFVAERRAARKKPATTIPPGPLPGAT